MIISITLQNIYKSSSSPKYLTSVLESSFLRYSRTFHILLFKKKKYGHSGLYKRLTLMNLASQEVKCSNLSLSYFKALILLFILIPLLIFKKIC